MHARKACKLVIPLPVSLISKPQTLNLPVVLMLENRSHFTPVQV